MQIGDRVLYVPGSYDQSVMSTMGGKLAATVVYVHPDGRVNVTVADSLGVPHVRTTVGVDAPSLPAEGYVEGG